MSFQGDVAGIGLGELLQGLARGGRDGVLTLNGDELSGALGLRKGMLYLLASPDENADLWRRRTACAFAEAPNPTLETARRSTIARAERLENLHRMLEASNLHFRFEPGALPTPPGFVTGDTSEADADSPWGPGTSVEYALLEHARISDEAFSGAANDLRAHDLPRALDPSSHSPDERDLLEQCDGRSTVQEIADRMGWPLLQARAVIGAAIERGSVRLAEPRELLAAAQRELAQGRIERAATRLAGWIEEAAPGAPQVGDADLLVSEWEAGRLEHVLPALPVGLGRALLRRLDQVHVDERASLTRWNALLKAHRGDEITALHEVVLRLVVQEETDARTFQDILRLARLFSEREQKRRTRTLLRVAASHLPSNVRTRIELGRRMMEAGLVDDGIAWLLDTARELIEAGEGERALLPIRTILQERPDEPRAAGLLLQARALLARKRRRRWNSMAAMGGLLAIAGVALVQMRSTQSYERRLQEVRDRAANPAAALALLDEHFYRDGSDRVADLRATLVSAQKERRERERNAWMERFRSIEDECRYGDPLLALRRALELPTPPEHGPTYDWPGAQDLFGALADRLEERSEELDLPIDATLDELHAEERLAILLVDLLDQVDAEGPGAERAFHFRIEALHDAIRTRREARALAREQRSADEKMQEQDILLASARAHANAGDLDRSIAAYERLIGMDDDDVLRELLADEMGAVRSHHRAVVEAIALADDGDHDAARARLAEGCENPSEHLLPWRLVSVPSGARVRFPDGTTRVSPFVVHSSIDEHLELEVQADECLTREVLVDSPRDRVVYLHREAERTWATVHRVDAAPVPTGDDHIVADRYGRVLRLDKDSQPRWERQLATLGGIARTPVYLTRRPGWMVALSEDGQAWLIAAADGSVEGPIDIGSPPVDGPTLTRGGVSARFADGRIALWTSDLEPEVYAGESLFPDPDSLRAPTGDGPGKLALMRRGAEADERLASPWTEWSVVVGEAEFFVTLPDGRGFTAERVGEWSYVAWEAPKALIKRGRLWVSDEAGLRSYLPGEGMLARYDERR